MTVKIIKGLPIPPKKHPGRPAKYPWATMEIGDAFGIDTKSIDSATSQASTAGKKHGRDFTCRTTSDGIIVWRVK